MSTNGPESWRMYRRFVMNDSVDLGNIQISAAAHVAKRPLRQQEKVNVRRNRSVVEGREETVLIRSLNFYAFGPGPLDINGYKVTLYENLNGSRRSKLIVGPFSSRLYLSENTPNSYFEPVLLQYKARHPRRANT